MPKYRYTTNIGGAFGNHNRGETVEGPRADFKILLDKGWVVEVADEIQSSGAPEDVWGSSESEPDSQ